jgi:purine-binding chemotaxis protein CheW
MPNHLLEFNAGRESMETKEQEAVMRQQYLTFFLADEEYAVNIQKVKEIIEYSSITKVPKVPRWIRGVINLRGNVVPVVDLAVRFGLDERPTTKTTCIVIVEVQQDTENTIMGVIADAVNQVIELNTQDIEEPPAFGTRVRLEYLAGMGKLGKKFALILNIDRVLSATELLTVAGVSSEIADFPKDNAQEAAERPEA